MFHLLQAHTQSWSVTVELVELTQVATQHHSHQLGKEITQQV
jgi:hypothetical protein